MDKCTLKDVNINAFYSRKIAKGVNYHKIATIGEKDDKVYPVSLFSLAIEYKWQGICYYLVERGLSLFSAIESALSNSQFMLAKNLLYKNQKDKL